MSKVYVGELGVNIILNTGQNISSATSVSIAVQYPDGTVGSWTSTIDSTTNVKHTTISTSLTQSGVYLLQAVVTLSGTQVFRGDTVQLPVYSNFN